MLLCWVCLYFCVFYKTTIIMFIGRTLTVAYSNPPVKRSGGPTMDFSLPSSSTVQAEHQKNRLQLQSMAPRATTVVQQQHDTQQQSKGVKAAAATKTEVTKVSTPATATTVESAKMTNEQFRQMFLKK
jgi:hypothetical protein